MWRDSPRRSTAQAAVDEAMHEAIRLAGAHPGTRHAFDRLLHRVWGTTTLLRTARGGGRIETRCIRQLITGLLAIACDRADWLRPLENWTPAGDGPRRQFASVALHLFARYPVPGFMTSVWFRGGDADSAKQQAWYKHIGLGLNIRTADLPLSYTKRMAHHFMEAPDHFTVEMALRWGQVRGLGGSEVLAKAVAATQLGQSFQHEDFWKTVLHFLANDPTLDPAHVGPIVDYLNVQRFVPQEDLIDEGELRHHGPLQPNLAMKGRTRRSLLRQVEEWHKRLRFRRGAKPIHWQRSDIGEFHYIEKEGRDREPHRVWTIRELLSSDELHREGLAMQHCVASYARACAGRASSIWSLRFENRVRRHRVMTIEVDMKRGMICQARRRRNAAPNDKAREILERWARQEELTIAEYL
jgi:hypothetical protein